MDNLKPKVFVMENVPGILSSNAGKTFESIKSEFSALGYCLSAQKLLASDYGVPQKRKRVFIVGTYNMECKFNPSKIFDDEINYLSVDDAISDLYDIQPSSCKDTPVEYNDNLFKSNYQKYLRNQIDVPELLNLISKSLAI